MSGRPKFVLGNKPGSAQAAPVAAQMPPSPQAMAEKYGAPKSAETPKPAEVLKPAPAQFGPVEVPKPAEAQKPAPVPAAMEQPKPAPAPRPADEPAPSTRKEPAATKPRSDGTTESARPKDPGRHDSGASAAVSNPPAMKGSFPAPKGVEQESIGQVVSQGKSGASVKKDAKDAQSGSSKNWAGFAGMVTVFGAVPATTLYLTGASNLVVGTVLALEVAIAGVYLLVSNKSKGDAVGTQGKDDGKTGGAAGAAS